MKILFFYLLLAIPTALNAQWGPDTKLSTNEVSANLSENMGQSIVAVGSTVHIVWADSGIDSGAIFYKRSLDGGVTWGPDTKISAPSGHDSFPLLAVSGNYVHVVYLENGDTPQAASYYKRSTDGGNTWGPSVFLATTTWWGSVAAVGSNVYIDMETKSTPTNSNVFFIRSTDNGNTWSAQTQISNKANGRSEDPAIAAEGSSVDLVWNDSRDTYPGKGMAVYYRHSSDSGVTWGPETALTHAPAFTYFPSIFLNGPNVDVPYGTRQGASGVYQLGYQNSTNLGSTWTTPQQLTNTTAGIMYPSVVRDGSNVHLVWGTNLVVP